MTVAAPPHVWFALGATSQYVGAAIAVDLFDSLSPATVTFVRVASAAAVLVAWRRPWALLRGAGDRRRAAAFGLVTAGMNLAFYQAIASLPLGTAVAVEFAGPVAVAALGTRGRRGLVALAAAGAGVVLLAEVRWEGSGAGIAWALAAAALWAGYILLGHRVAAAGTGLDGLAVGLAVGAVALAPVGLGGSGPLADRPSLLVVAVLVGVLSSVVPYGLDQVVLPRLTPASFALLLSLLPATATVVGLVALGQVPGGAELTGIALVALAVALAPIGGSRPARRGHSRAR